MRGRAICPLPHHRAGRAALGALLLALTACVAPTGSAPTTPDATARITPSELPPPPPPPVGASQGSVTATPRKLGRVEQKALAMGLLVLKNPAIQERIRGLDRTQQQALIAKLTLDGLMRLPDAVLVERTRLMGEAIDGADETTCGRLLGAKPVDLGLGLEVLASLSDASLERWGEIARQAAEAELREDPRRAPSEEQVMDAVALLLTHVAESDAQRFLVGLGGADTSTPAEACWTVRTLYGAFGALSPEQQGPVARVLAMQ